MCVDTVAPDDGSDDVQGNSWYQNTARVDQLKDVVGLEHYHRLYVHVLCNQIVDVSVLQYTVAQWAAFRNVA